MASYVLSSQNYSKYLKLLYDSEHLTGPFMYKI